MDTWKELEAELVAINRLPHNRHALRGTPEADARRKLAEIRGGLASLTREEFTGPKLFLRAAGPGNRAYSGEWWFDAAILDNLQTAYSRVYFQTADRKRAIRDMLRDGLAVSTEWNPMTEIWALELPPGERLRGYSGPGNPQRLFADLPLSHAGNRMLMGRVQQFFFPVKNPLWVKIHAQL